MRSPLVGLTLVILAGCCSTDPVDLSDPEAEVRREALACLSEDAFEDTQLRSLVKKAATRLCLLSNEPDPAVRIVAIGALGRLRVASAIPLVAVALVGDGPQTPPDPHPRVRLQAVTSLGMMGEHALALAALRVALRQDEAHDVRLAAARELGEMADLSSSTTEALIVGLADEHQAVRLNARRSLRWIHGIDLGLKAQTWDSWYERQPAAKSGLGRDSRGPGTGLPFEDDSAETPVPGFEDELPFEDDGVPFEDDGVPFEDDGVPFEDDGVPFEDDGVPFEDDGVPFEDDGVPFEDDGEEDPLPEDPAESDSGDDTD